MTICNFYYPSKKKNFLFANTVLHSKHCTSLIFVNSHKISIFKNPSAMMMRMLVNEEIKIGTHKV